MAETASRSDPSPPAAKLGAELQAARRALGWELPQLASSLRIRQSYLEAIETGCIAELPGTTYALGFVRAYAAALGLPGEEMARRFRAQAEGVNGKPTLHFPAPVPRRGVPAGALMLLGLVILASSYGGWYWVTEHRATPVETVPPIPDRLAPDTQKPAPSPQVASILPSTAPPAAAPLASSPPGTSTPAPAPAPTPPATAPAPTATPPSGPAPESTATPIPNPALSPVPASTQAAPTAPAGTRIVVTATADAWLTVKQPAGPPLLNKMLHAGDTWPVPTDKTGLTLNTGNAGATVITVDGAPIPQTLGTSGMVRRDVPLDADLLKSGKLPPPKTHTKPTPTPPT
jgi:cytoskeleton protein RodZ